MWVQQAQFYKSQERIFNERLKDVLNQNKKLQEDNDILTRKNEKLYIKIALSHEESNCLHEEGNIHVIEHLSRNNERLRYRNNQLVQKNRILEKALEEGTEGMSEAEKQMQNCLREIQIHKRTIQNINLDRELETAVLQRKIEASDNLFQNAIEASDNLFQNAIQQGESVIEEIFEIKQNLPSVFSEVNWIQQGESVIEEIFEIKQNLPSVFSEVNWRDLQRSGNILQDIFMTCKLYVKDMAAYIVQVHHNISHLEENSQTNANECLKLREALDMAKIEVNNSLAT
ncbi:hypothetical protein QE152_g39182 [Popillia japonica]|uniref:Uncharacterized protein n=1 Tax=Popillia japonica TaxID=7064 RepID=A0AAW1HUS4_POPJA